MTRDEVFDVVKKHMREILDDLPEEAIDPARSMRELGANSLDMVEIVSCAMRELKVKVPRAELATLKNLDGLVGLLHGAVEAKQEAGVR
jgi:acyl carrier protein